MPGRLNVTLLTVLVALIAPGGLQAEVLRFDSRSQWTQWQMPADAIDITSSGGLQPVPMRKRNNATLDANRFGGSVRVSSNDRTAGFVIDGDRDTGWRPDGTESGNAFIEIDLGRSVSTHSVTLVFSDSAPPFELFEVNLSTGEPQVDIVGNPVPGNVVYRMQRRFKENTRHEVTIEFDPLQDPPIQYVRVEPLLIHGDAELTEIEVLSFGDNASLGLLERGGSADVVLGLGRAEFNLPLGNARTLFDGSMATRMRFGAAPGRGANDILAHIVMDLGAVYWADHIRIVGEAMSFRRFTFKDYSLLTSDGSLAPDGTLIWNRQFNGRRSDDDNRRGFVDHHFPLQPVRLVRVLWRFWDGACASFLGGGQNETFRACAAVGTTQELQVFGEGFPREITLGSPILDLGERRNFGAVEWEGLVPAGTRLEIRSRTGDEVVERQVFTDRNGKQVTERAWGKLIPSFRGPIDTLQSVGGDWSPWSTSYETSGERFQSPSPRRYVELRVDLLTDQPEAAPTLVWLQLTHTPPLALRALGEIFPSEVRPGVVQEFSYFVRTDSASAGFDGLSLEASAPPTFVDAFLSSQRVDVERSETERGFRITMPRRVRGGELLELRFTSAVFLHGTRFEAFLEDSRLPDDRQRVDEGDATPDVASNTNIVGLPVGDDLLANVVFMARVISPNGDGVNDELRIDVDVVNVLLPRQLTLEIFDLAGRQVYRERQLVEAGRQQLRWEARDTGGRTVPPGVYVVKLNISGDARSESVRRTVAVVY